MLNSSLSDYVDAYMLVSGTLTFVGAGPDATAKATDRNDK